MRLYKHMCYINECKKFIIAKIMYVNKFKFHYSAHSEGILNTTENYLCL